MNSTHDDRITEPAPQEAPPPPQWQSAAPTPPQVEPLAYPSTHAGPAWDPAPTPGYGYAPGGAFTTPAPTVYGYAVGPNGQPAPHIPGTQHFPPVTPTTTNRLAVISLILGIASLLCCGLLLGIPAIITGAKAQRQVIASRGAQTGHGMATAGIVLGTIITALSAVGIFVAILQALLAGIAQ